MSSINSETEKSKNKVDLPWLMDHYKNSDFATQLKARFVYYLSITIVVCMFLIVSNTIFSQPRNPFYHGIYWPIILLETFAFLLYICCFLILIKGYFNLASHLFIIISFACVWTVMFVDKSLSLSRLDTIVYIFAVLSATPILVIRNKITIVLYSAINLIMLTLFVLMIDKKFDDIFFDFTEYFADNAIAMVFVSITAYNVFAINKILLDKAHADIRERAIAEESLAASEKKYREMTGLLPQTIFETDLNGVITYVNDAGLRLFGYTFDEFKKGVNIIETIAPNDRERASVNMKLIAQKRGHVGNRYLALKKDGTTFPVIIFSSVIENNNVPVGVRGITIDNSEREKAQEALKQSENRFRNLFENAPISMVQLSLDGTILRFNNQAHKLFGYNMVDIPNLETWWIKAYPNERYRKEVIEIWNQEMQKALENKTNLAPIEFRITNKYDEVLTMLVGASYLDDTVVISFFDITERKNAERALKESEELFKNLIPSLPYAIVLTDTNGNIIKANKTYCTDLGLPENLLENSNVYDLGFVYKREQLEILQESMAKTGRCENIEMDVVDNNGKSKTVYISSQIMTMNNQKVILSSSVDVTEKKKIETELDNYRRNLENLVAERTVELNDKNNSLKNKNDELQKALDNLSRAHQQLVESDKMATLGVLAAGIAHEINNPLNFIHGGIIGLEDYFDQFLKEHLEPVAPLIDAINTGVDRASKIVSSLNHFSRQTESTAEKCNIHGIIDNCFIMLENQLKYKAKIIKNYTDEPFEVFGNDGKLHQAFLNILTNAVHSLNENGTITATTRLISNNLVIWFSDTGKGIHKAHLDRIFEPFFTTKAPGIGSGLGLSITYNIINEHNGKIEVVSELNKGTTFKIWLPVQQEVIKQIQ